MGGGAKHVATEPGVQAWDATHVRSSPSSVRPPLSGVLGAMVCSVCGRGACKGRARVTPQLCNVCRWFHTARLDRPGVYQRVLYNGHKRCHCVKWQGLTLPNGIMPFPFGPVNGRHNDAFMLDASQLERILRRKAASRRASASFTVLMVIVHIPSLITSNAPSSTSCALQLRLVSTVSCHALESRMSGGSGS